MNSRTIRLNPDARSVVEHGIATLAAAITIATVKKCESESGKSPCLEMSEEDAASIFEGSDCTVSISVTLSDEAEKLGCEMTQRSIDATFVKSRCSVQDRVQFAVDNGSSVIENNPFSNLTFANVAVRSGMALATMLLRLGRVRLDELSVKQTVHELEEEWQSEVLYYGSVREQIGFSWCLPVDALHMIGEFGVIGRVRHWVFGESSYPEDGLADHACECDEENRSNQVDTHRF